MIHAFIDDISLTKVNEDTCKLTIMIKYFLPLNLKDIVVVKDGYNKSFFNSIYKILNREYD